MFKGRIGAGDSKRIKESVEGSRSESVFTLAFTGLERCIYLIELDAHWCVLIEVAR